MPSMHAVFRENFLFNFWNRFSNEGPKSSMINMLYLELYPKVFIAGKPNAFKLESK